MKNLVVLRSLFDLSDSPTRRGGQARPSSSLSYRVKDETLGKVSLPPMNMGMAVTLEESMVLVKNERKFTLSSGVK
jgi:hypothetical protein